MLSSSDLTLAWNVATREQWDDCLCRAGRSPLEQSWAYGDAMESHYGQTVDRVVVRHGERTVAILQVFHKRLMGFASIIRIVRGPLLLDECADDALRYEIYRAVHDVFPFRRWEIPLWLPDMADDAENQRLMRRLGTRRMVTGLSSAWLDLRTDLETLRSRMTGGWRNALTAAEKNGTSVVVEDNEQALGGLMADYDAFRRGKRFIGPPGNFIIAMDQATGQMQDVVVLTAHADGNRIAGIVMIRHGLSATYFVGWTSEEGRRHRAHNLLLWKGIQVLKTHGSAWLDMGGLNTGPAAGIARFKLGLKPEPFTLVGTFL